MPVRTLLDVVSGVPIALLVWPDYRAWLFDKSWAVVALPVLIILRFALGAYRRGSTTKLVRATLQDASTAALPAIELAHLHAQDHVSAQPPLRTHVRRSIETVLQAIAELTKVALQVPQGVEIHANLMIPMPVLVEGETAPKPGLGIVAYNTESPAEPSWSRVVEGDFGAGTVMQMGKVQVIEDTDDPMYCRQFLGMRAKSFASFPLRDESEQVIAVVNVDADRRMVFRSGGKKSLWTVISGQLVLLTGILESTRG